jgi:L,D-peptidoglycan transpeptidase YkuD (ErfK/YbiS/YcfS/YnhG family)
MIIHVPNKNTLIIDDFKFRCCVGKRGIKSNKKEGDYSTPRGLFSLRKLYFRKDRTDIPNCKINKKIIKKGMAWCDDPEHTKYNEEIKTHNTKLKENLYRKDHKYDYVISISHNEKKIPGKGSAIFIHLTNNYTTTAGCIALKKKDFEILLKLIDKKTKIKIG